ncbi:MAG: FAD-binding oxidoreductase, partial [Rhodobacteraceae bacterium]|nr:FAD-binding oxidoreductase [Paracoccaceae bacterium]
MNLLHANDRAGEYPPSYYAATRAEFAPLPALQGALRADVCIVGGGYTGLSAALHLAQRGMKVVVLEAHRVGFGASGRNGGQVGSGQRLDQDALEAAVGLADAKKLWDFAQEAKDMVRGLIAAHDMPVRFHPGIAHACWSEGEVRGAQAYADKLRRDYGYDQVEPLSREAIGRLIPSGVFAGGEMDRGAGHVHPLNYAIGLARAAQAAGAVIHERSEVTAITQGATPVVTTAQGTVTCDHLILACNGYLGGLEPQVAARVMPINNFIVATEPLGDRAAEVLAEPVAVADTKFVVN